MSDESGQNDTMAAADGEVVTPARIDLARARVRARTPDELLERCEYLYQMTLGELQTWTNASGKEKSRTRVDYNAAIKVTELQARLLGMLGGGTDLDAIKRELDKLGLRVTPKASRVA